MKEDNQKKEKILDLDRDWKQIQEEALADRPPETREAYLDALK